MKLKRFNEKFNENKMGLIEIYQDTKERVLSGEIKTVADILYNFGGGGVTTKHKVEEINSLNRGNFIPNIQTINSDTVSAALTYSKLGKTAILNMASAKRPGGGVENGARAQEECLFRCSNLFNLIDESYYPLGINEGLYTTDAIFFKDKDYNLIDPFKVDVITVPALNLNNSAKYDNLNLVSDYDKITKDKIRLMFYLAKKNGCENIILGAWGCGVFKNNPVDIARLFEEVMYERKSDYSSSFKNIIFAVINDHNSVSDNFDVFLKYF
jgi:uncharacterized protein (TIGR02452 family)